MTPEIVSKILRVERLALVWQRTTCVHGVIHSCCDLGKGYADDVIHLCCEV